MNKTTKIQMSHGNIIESYKVDYFAMQHQEMTSSM